MHVNDKLAEALDIAHAASGMLLGVPESWQYRDFPNMLPEYWELLETFIGKNEMKVWIMSERVWPDGVKTVRGQVFISPQGLENLRVNAEEYYKDTEIQ